MKSYVKKAKMKWKNFQSCDEDNLLMDNKLKFKVKPLKMKGVKKL